MIPVRILNIFTFILLSLVCHSCRKTEDNTIRDADGNIYTPVIIGTQTWLVENLKTTKYNDGSAIPLVTDNSAWLNTTAGAYCWYENDFTTYRDKYGALYNWYAVDNNAATKIASNGGKNVCPVGWHVPSLTELTTMEYYLIANGYSYDGSLNYNKIGKSLSSLTGWTPSAVTGAVGNTDFPAYRNKTGFTALPGGRRHLGVPEFFMEIGNYGYWWSATAIQDLGVGIYLFFDSYDSNLIYTNKQIGFSVRCLKD